jgi:hypothetical protein
LLFSGISMEMITLTLTRAVFMMLWISIFGVLIDLERIKVENDNFFLNFYCTSTASGFAF